MLNPKNIVSLCECGCNQPASPGKRFISGHNRRGNGTRDLFCKKGRWYVTTRISNQHMPWSHVVMWDKTGTPVGPGEIVHHEDEDFRNDDPDNLVLYASQTEHMLACHPQEWAWQMLKAAVRELGTDAVRGYLDAQ